MINSQTKSSGFMTLTITLIIIILVTVIVLMTGKMLMSEQRSAANDIRYKEAMSAAQAGLEAAMAKLSVDNASRTKITNTSSIPYYQVTFGSDINIQVGSGTLPVVSLTSVGTSGYSSTATNTTNAESQVTLQEQVLVGRVVSGTPDAPLTVAAGMAAGGNFTVAANPNGGGPGVPLSIWSPTTVTIGSSGSTCGQQEYYDGTCGSNSYSNNKLGVGADILQNDTANFPSNLLTYVFGVNTINDVEKKLNDKGRQVMPDCSQLDASSSGLYMVKGTCDLQNKTVGSRANPVVLVVWDGNLKMNGNSVFYGIIFCYADTSGYEAQLNGGATIYGALLANANVALNNTNGTYNAVYDQTVLKNIETGSALSFVARVSGSWRDW